MNQGSAVIRLQKMLPGAVALALAAIVYSPAASATSTAANTVIINVATVNYNDAGNNAQTPVTATASVTVTLVPSAPLVVSPANTTINQGTSATLTYTLTSTANGPDTYSFGSVATPTNDSTVTPTVPANITLGGTTLASPAVAGNTTITVPYDNNVGGAAAVNGLAVGNTIVIGGLPYVITGTITKNPGTNNSINTATITLATAITGATVPAGSIVGQQVNFTVTVPSGNVTSGSSGSQSVVTTVTSTTSPAASTSGSPVVITVNRPTLTVAKTVAVGAGAFGASGSAAPGATLTYQIVASNTGTTSATAVAFTDAIPPYLTYVAGSGKFSQTSGATYASATALTDNAGGYTVTTVGAVTTVSYTPTAPTSTVPGSGVLILFFKATIN